MFYESELLTQFHKICYNAEVLALKSLHDIELPLCGHLTELTSSDCLKIIKSELDDWDNLNQPSTEKILLIYIITDYVSCGLSSPTFYTVFHSNLQSNKSKIKLLKDLITLWDCLFKNYEITSVNVDFIKLFVVSLERLFLKLSNFHNCIKFQCIQVINRLNYNIKLFNQSFLDCKVLHTLSDNYNEHTSYKRKLFNFENIIQSNLKINPSVTSSCLQTKQNIQNMNYSTTSSTAHKRNLDLLHSNSTFNSGAIDPNFSKNSMLLSNSEENSQDKNIISDSIMIQSGQKLNAFQIMMSNAKKRKTETK